MSGILVLDKDQISMVKSGDARIIRELVKDDWLTNEEL